MRKLTANGYSFQPWKNAMTAAATIADHHVEVTDTTGAGDCFTGAYLAELDRGAEPVDAARFAGVAASLSCMAPGARNGIPVRAQVLTYLDGSADPG